MSSPEFCIYLEAISVVFVPQIRYTFWWFLSSIQLQTGLFTGSHYPSPGWLLLHLSSPLGAALLSVRLRHWSQLAAQVLLGTLRTMAVLFKGPKISKQEINLFLYPSVIEEFLFFCRRLNLLFKLTALDLSNLWKHAEWHWHHQSHHKECGTHSQDHEWQQSLWVKPRPFKDVDKEFRGQGWGSKQHCSGFRCIFNSLSSSFSGMAYDMAFLIHHLNSSMVFKTAGCKNIHSTDLGKKDDWQGSFKPKVIQGILHLKEMRN